MTVSLHLNMSPPPLSLQNGPLSLWARATASSSSPVACWFLPMLTTSSAKSALDSSARPPPMPSAFTVTPTGEAGVLGRQCRGRRAWSVRWCLWMKRMGLTCCTAMLAALWDTGCRPSVWMTEQCFRKGSWCSGWWSPEMAAMVAVWDFLPLYIYVILLTITYTNPNISADTGLPAWTIQITPTLPLQTPPLMFHPVTPPLQTSSPPPGWYTPTQHGPPRARTWVCSSAYFPAIPTAGAAPGWSTRAPAPTLTSPTWSCHPHLVRHPLWPSPACLSAAPEQPTTKSASASSPSTNSLTICPAVCSWGKKTRMNVKGIRIKSRGQVAQADMMLRVCQVSIRWRRGGRRASWPRCALCLKCSF